MTVQWEEVDGFVSPGEYDRFRAFLQRQVAAGVARQVPVDPDYRGSQVSGGEWYQDLETGETWRLVPPDFPFRGLWEKVEQTGASRIDEPAFYIGERRIPMPCRVKESFHCAGSTIVLLDPDAYMKDPDYSQERRRGVDPLRNLRAYSQAGELLWEAEFPQQADYYYRIESRSPLVALSFSSYRCRIDPATGRIVSAEFLK